MTEPHRPDDGRPADRPGQRPTDAPAAEPVGSLGEEAAKLFGVLSDWTREATPQDPGAEETTGPASRMPPGLGATLSGLADQAAATFSEMDAHVATGSSDCTFCPICRTVHAVRQTSPEVRTHLAAAASSFLQAVVGMLATVPPPEGGRQPGGVERIDLDDPGADDPADPDHEDDDR